MELSEFLARQIKKELNIDIMVGNFINTKFDIQFDLITMRHVLEHIPDFNLVMTQIYNILKPDGFAVLEFPNIQGICFKYKRFLQKNNLYYKKYKNNYKPGRCNEFSKKAFLYLANHNNFRLLHWGTYSSTGIGNILNKPFKFGTKARVLIQKI